MTITGEEERDDIVQRAIGRARFLRRRGEVKTPEIIEGLLDKIGALNMELIFATPNQQKE